MKIVIASKNPVKINAAVGAFQKLFPGQEIASLGISVPSGVKDQPMSDQETFLGATNRALAARNAHPDADYWVGLEGGVEEIEQEMRSTVWCVVCSKEKTGKGKAGSFYLPPRMVELIKQGMEMGDADDIIFGTTNSKQTTGAIGLLTKNIIDRTALYEPAVVLAMIPFINPELYPA